MPINPEHKSDWQPNTFISRGMRQHQPAVIVAFESLVADAIATSEDSNVIVNRSRPEFQRELIMPFVLDQLHEEALTEKRASETVAESGQAAGENGIADHASASERFFASRRREDGSIDWNQVAKDTEYVVKRPPIKLTADETVASGVDQREMVM